MTHPSDIFDPLAILHIEAAENADEALARWRAEGRYGPMDPNAPMLYDIRYVNLWASLLGIAAESSDGGAESLKQLMFDSLTVAFFASRLYERVRSELNGGGGDGAGLVPASKRPMTGGQLRVMSAFEFAVLFGIACCVLWNVLAVKQMLEKHDDHAPSDDNDEGWSSQGTLRIE